MSGNDVKLLNIGSGITYHPAWVNIDVEPVSSEILRHDVRKPLPFKDDYFDACYSSHVLEHLRCDEARRLLVEIHRILKPGGILRVVVPDLESIVRAYLSTLERVLSKQKVGEQYDWVVLELLDQMVRGTSGGQMADFLRKCPDDAREFIVSRIGNEAKRFWEFEKSSDCILSRIAGMPPWWFMDKLRFLLLCCFGWVLGGTRGVRSVREGWFRTSGEVHRWMYDQFSLGRLLEKSGFIDLVVCAPDNSRIPEFSSFGLDVAGGMVRKPDSLFMEGVCP